ncbi:phosphoenolpyruvate hydrolase family protein [Ancylobacter sp. A5.8]|uniref:phosphoenolpyruvate hydrolase family protein n=1 Tax=Ancylobacter gelatini TaxID=2919920 RepID=UPI001F4F0442|nr:phosphoenolpyruvate hydrolase family protein [Ancylobacter gelatini]MCJ8144071.1 phosphoenolpyruvate hydrolase family protein [Ancylobacter gelatini]
MQGVIVDNPASPSAAAAEFVVLAPYLAGLSPEAADIVGMMPIGSVNETLLAALPVAGLAPPRKLVAAVFLCDPFLSGRRLFERLRARGVSGVVNLPTTSLVPPGVYRQALTAAGIDPGAELAALGEARQSGLEVMATVASYDQAARAVEAGVATLLFHPGTPTGEAALDLRLVEGVVASIGRIRSMPQRPRVALYRHPGFGGRLAPAGDLVEDVLDWAVSAPRVGVEAASPQPV